MLNIVLVEPEIPSNTGNIARTCAATRSRLHLVKPLGFDISDKAVKRAGLDYWHMVDISVYENIDDFFCQKSTRPVLAGNNQGQPYIHQRRVYRRLLPSVRQGNSRTAPVAS